MSASPTMRRADKMMSNERAMEALTGAFSGHLSMNPMPVIASEREAISRAARSSVVKSRSPRRPSGSSR